MRHQGLEDAKLAKSVRYTVKANWKLIFENNRECYHCNTAHPEYVQGTYDTRALLAADSARGGARREQLASERFARMGLGDAMASSEMTGAYWRAARTPLVEGWETQSLDGKPVAPLMGTFRARNEWSAGTLRSTIFPNFWQHASDDHAVATRITPIDATTSSGRCVLVRAQGRGRGQGLRPRQADAVLAAHLRAGLGDLRGQPGRHPVAALRAGALFDACARPTCSISSTGISARSAARARA